MSEPEPIINSISRCPLCHQEVKPKVPRNEIQKVVFVYKIVSGHEPEDKAWDKVYFPRYMKPAKELIDFLGDWKKAGDCIQDIYEKFTHLGFKVTMETIVKHAADWKKDNCEKEEKKNGVLPVPRNGHLPTNGRGNNPSSFLGEELGAVFTSPRDPVSIRTAHAKGEMGDPGGK